MAEQGEEAREVQIEGTWQAVDVPFPEGWTRVHFNKDTRLVDFTWWNPDRTERMGEVNVIPLRVLLDMLDVPDDALEATLETRRWDRFQRAWGDDEPPR